MKTCQSCGASVPDAAKFCGKCGHEVQSPGGNKCRACGYEMKETDKFCPACGFGNTTMGGPSDSPPIPSYVPPQETPRGPYVQSAQSSYASQTAEPSHNNIKCRNCGYIIPAGMNRCQYCGAMIVNYKPKDYAGIAGAIMLLVGAINLVLFGLASWGSTLNGESAAYTMTMAVLAIANIFVAWAGTQALKRRKFRLCLIASLISLISITLFIAPFGLLFLVLSKDAFQDDKRKDNAFKMRY